MKHLTPEQQAILLLLRQSLWGAPCGVPSGVNWETADRIAKEQAVISYAYDGAMTMKAEIPPEILQKWKNTLFRGVAKNERLLKAQDELVAKFAQAEIPAVILKGSSVARYYPQPDLRILGDTDILVKKADVERAREILEQIGYVFHEADHEFHMGFTRPGSYVELHYNVTYFPDSAGGRITAAEIEGFLEDIHQGSVGNHHFPVLSERNQGLSLLLHMIRHMFEGGIGLRQLSDWAVYVANADAVRFAETTVPMLERCGLLQYAKVATRACVLYLGLPERDLSWCEGVEEEMCRAFLTEVFCGGNMGTADKESAGSWFTDEKAMGNAYSSLEAIFARLTRLSYQNYPITRKCKILLPFFWVFLPIRYWVRSLLGLRPKKSVTGVVGAAKRRRQLYDMLKMYEVDDCGDAAER